MTFLRANKLLQGIAHEYELQQRHISSKEIQKRLAEIKYLSSQRDVPKLTLRREILQLEKRMENLFAAEKRIAKQKRSESSKIAALKRENEKLKNQFLKSKDPHLVQKVEKLSHLLGDILAKASTREEILSNETALNSLDKNDRARVERMLHPPQPKIDMQRLLEQLNRIKKTIAEYRLQDRGEPEQLDRLDAMVQRIERRLLSSQDGLGPRPLPSQQRIPLVPRRLPEQQNEVKKMVRHMDPPPLPKKKQGLFHRGSHKAPEIIHEGKEMPKLKGDDIPVGLPSPPPLDPNNMKDASGHNLMFKPVDVQEEDEDPAKIEKLPELPIETKPKAPIENPLPLAPGQKQEMTQKKRDLHAELNASIDELENHHINKHMGTGLPEVEAPKKKRLF